MTDSRTESRRSGLTKSLFANALLLPPATIGAAVIARRMWRARQAPPSPPPASRVPVVSLAEFDPVFAPHPVFGPTREAEVRFIGRGNMHVLGGTTDLESWVLAVLAKRARQLFEFGTCTGKTTYLWAVNSPPDARIATLTLPPEAADAITRGRDDEEAPALQIAAGESVCTEFVYTRTEAEPKVTQLFADSIAFDETPYVGACDLVFVDGAHSYSYVRSDTNKALRMVRPGGVVLWHDYYRNNADPAWGPNVYLDELVDELPLVHLEDTSIVAYRRPAG